METQTKISVQDIIKLLPDRITLHSTDYRDNLDEHTETLQKCLSERCKDSLYEKVDDWYMDDFYGMDYVKDELISDMQNEFDIDEDEAKDIFEEYRDEIEEEIYNRDDSDVISELLNNTNNSALFIDSGLEFNGYGNSEAEYRLDRMRIKKFFNITDSSQDKDIDMMLYQSGYGGSLRVYFNCDFKEILDAVESYKGILFDGSINIAIVNSSEGSGDHCEITGKCVLPLDVFICEEVKYSYTHEVCGMYDDWCNSTQYKFMNDAAPEILSNTKEYMLREDELNKVYKSGKCTFGDMKYTRHRNTVYINDYPCGTRCLDCGTFWID